MHPAWFTDDIWKLLIEHLRPCDLAILAQTNKELSSLSLDQLWHTVTSFEPFMSCLPKDHRHRILRPEELERLDFYAGKVRVLSLEGESTTHPLRLPPPYHIHINEKRYKKGKSWETLWTEIDELRPNKAFLPHLRKLRINNADERYLRALVGISGSKLEHVYAKYLHTRQNPSVVSQFLESLQDISKLEYLFVRDGQDLIPSSVLMDAPLKHIRLDPRISANRHQDLHYKIFPLRPEILHKDTLEHLTIGLTKQWYTSDLKLDDGKYLSNLQTLWLNLTTLESDTFRKSSGSPVRFLKALDQPRLKLLNIKFRYDATGSQFLDVVKAAKQSCQLGNLKELALAGGGWFDNCPECGARPAPLIKPSTLRKALQHLLPLPNLKVLRISVAPNFLDILDMNMYKGIAAHLPNLEKLHLGHGEFYTGSIFSGTVIHESVPLRHVAAFCHLFPNLMEVTVGTLYGKGLEQCPELKWTSWGVKKVQWRWNTSKGAFSGDSDFEDELVYRNLMVYFPHSDMTAVYGAKLKLREARTAVVDPAVLGYDPGL
ncbi:hypothetical protein N0V90_009063 [Kalmusia sp. IMI 367209]|nr:hypothetical protein N0V90_009063 [Kalmusia sp. IMI 367209]